MNKTSSGADYQYHVGHEAHTDRLLKPHVLRYARESKARSVIDIGCGNWTMLRELSIVCAQVVGLDPSDSGINEARKICSAGKFHALGVYDFLFER